MFIFPRIFFSIYIKFFLLYIFFFFFLVYKIDIIYIYKKKLKLSTFNYKSI